MNLVPAILALAVVCLSGQAQTTVNVTNYGAKGDAQQVWVNTTSNSVAVAFTNSLSAADIGKAIELFDVGQQQVGMDNANSMITGWSQFVQTADTNYWKRIGTITNIENGTNIFVNVQAAYVMANIPPVDLHTSDGYAQIIYTNTVYQYAAASALSTNYIGCGIVIFNGQNAGAFIYTNPPATHYQGLIATITNVIGTNAYVSGDIPEVTSNGVYCIYGTDNSPCFQAAVAAAAVAGTNTVVNIPAGTFLLIPPCQYTNFAPNPNVMSPWVQGFVITRGGLVFNGAGQGQTVLQGMGAYKQQQGWYYYSSFTTLDYGDECVRGQIFNVITPCTNTANPLVFQNLTFDGGMPLAYDGFSGNEYANPVDGLGWDGTSGAGYDTGTDGTSLPLLQIFSNCEFRHMKGEMIKGLTSDTGSSQMIISNCFFWDGNGTAFNCNPAHTITSCLFSNMSQIEEFYLAHSQMYPSYFINNTVTNIYHCLIALNGGTLTNQPYIISNNVFYAAFNGSGIATAPAANVTICRNQIIGNPDFNCSAIVIGQVGTQPGSTDACNTNICVYSNTVVNCSQFLQLEEGESGSDNSHANGVWACNNTISGTRTLQFVNAGVWSTNIFVCSNDLSGVSANICVLSGGNGGQYAFISTNNNYWATIILNGEWGPTNAISYDGGSRFRMTYPYSSNVPNYLVTSDSNYIPSGAAIVITNAAYGGASVPVYFDQTMTSSVTLTNTQAMTFYWTGSAWTNNLPAPPTPPTNLHPMN